VAGIGLLHVHYKGSAPAVTDSIGGQMHMFIDGESVLLPLIKSGCLRALAVTGPRREDELPGVLTAREQGQAGAKTAAFEGSVGPAGLPREVMDRRASGPAAAPFSSGTCPGSAGRG